MYIGVGLISPARCHLGISVGSIRRSLLSLSLLNYAVACNLRLPAKRDSVGTGLGAAAPNLAAYISITSLAMSARVPKRVLHPSRRPTPTGMRRPQASSSGPGALSRQIVPGTKGNEDGYLYVAGVKDPTNRMVEYSVSQRSKQADSRTMETSVQCARPIGNSTRICDC